MKEQTTGNIGHDLHISQVPWTVHSSFEKALLNPGRWSSARGGGGGGRARGGTSFHLCVCWWLRMQYVSFFCQEILV